MTEIPIGGDGAVKRMTVEGIRESARMIHYGAGHDAILFLLEELDSAKKVQTVTDQSWRKLVEEREKLIEGLRWYSNLRKNGSYMGKLARDTLKSIGIDV